MDDLDALLNELHQTNLQILQRNKSNGDFENYGNYSLSHKPINFNNDIPATTEYPFTKAQKEHKNNHNSNVQELDAMLESLDNSEYVHVNYSTQTYPSFNRSRENRSKSHSNSQDISTNHEHYTDSIDMSSSQTKETKLAAQEAAKQLDDLLYSLKQFKITNQHDTDLRSPEFNNSSSSLPHRSHQNEQINKLMNQSSDSNNLNTKLSGSILNDNYSNMDGSVHNNDVNGYSGASLGDFNNNNDTKSNANQSKQRNTDYMKQDQSEIIETNIEYRLSNYRPTQLLDSMLNDLSSELSQQGANTNSRGMCHACKKPIVGTLITAVGKEWHPEHFVCAGCRTGLMRQDFYEQDDQAYCTKCHLQMFSPKCGYCGEAIVEKCIIALSRAWHPEHFFCCECQHNFNGSVTVHQHEDKLYCSTCYFCLFGTPCTGCQQPITDAYITALDLPWHKDCFTCHDCNKVLVGSSFHEVDGYPYCDSHYYLRRGLLCVACSTPITGRCVNALGRRYHPEHFTCAYCLNLLQTGTFKEHSGKPYCHHCFAQLFG